MIILNKISLKLKLTLLFSLIFTCLLLGFSYILYHEFTRIQSEVFDTTLYNYAVDVAESLDIDSYGEVEFDPDIIKLNEKILPFKLGKSYISVLDLSGNIVARSSNIHDGQILLVSDAAQSKVLKKGAAYDILVFRNVPHRVINYLLPVLKIDSPLILQVSVPMTAFIDTNKNFRKFFIVAIPAIMLISSLIGYFFVGRSLLPMLNIISKTKQIEASNLDDRVPTPDAKDEIWQLAETINHLLTRLNESFKSQERFIQDASHQLKTPLAIIKGELDLFKSGKKSEKESAAFLDSLSQEIATLIKLTNDLLILARVESGNSQLDFLNINISDVILTQVSRLSKLAAQKEISIHINFESFEQSLEKDLLVFCDPDLLGILFYNLIENAIKYSPPNSTVSIFGLFENGNILVSISDEGEGIAEQKLEKIFNRFYRVEGSSKKAQGSGLGLAICKVVSDSLNAKLWAENKFPKGTVFNFKIATSDKGSV